MLSESYHTMLDWLERFMLPCFFKALFKADCPGCGLQRSLFFLLKGDLQKSLDAYLATIPILLLFLFCFLQIRFQFNWGNRLLIFFYSCTGFLILFQYFYKLSNHS